jgi:hypothetical protein
MHSYQQHRPAILLNRDSVSLTAVGMDWKRAMRRNQIARTAARFPKRGANKMITGIFDLLRVEQTARVAIAVPTHKLGLGLAERIKEEARP